MPYPRFKLCETCDQFSFHRGASRDLRCDAPLPPPLEGFCRSRQVRPITLTELNADRRDLRREISELRTETHRLGIEGDERDEVIADLRATHRADLENLTRRVADLAARVEAAETRARDAEERAEALARELRRGGLRLDDLRRR